MKLNICCGKDYKEGYTNVDFSNLGSDGTPIKVDLVWNLLSEIWPTSEFAKGNCAQEIVFREALEHFNRWNGLVVLRKLFYLLEPGGILDLTVPPAEKQLKMYLMWMNRIDHIDDFLKAHERFSCLKWHDDLMGATHESDGTDGDSHKTLFSSKMLRLILEHVGFRIISIDDNIHVKATK
jgi:hypothetical protein